MTTRNRPSRNPGEAVDNDLLDTDRLRAIGIVVSDDPDHWLIRIADEVDQLRKVAEAALAFHQHSDDAWERGMAEHATDAEWWERWEDRREELLHALGVALGRKEAS